MTSSMVMFDSLFVEAMLTIFWKTLFSCVGLFTTSFQASMGFWTSLDLTLVSDALQGIIMLNMVIC